MHTSQSTLPWIFKYLPTTTKDIVQQEEQIKQLKDFLQNFSKNKAKAVIIHGPTGCGKTSAVYALAHELNYEVVEVNASDARNADALNSLVGQASKQRSLFAQHKLILVDEIDGLSGHKDRGGVQALVEIIASSHQPIILTAMNPYEQKLNSLRKICTLIEFRALDYLAIFHLLKRICAAEKIHAEDIDVKTLARRAAGDARAAINDLQILTSTTKTLRPKDLEDLASRYKSESILQALVKILKVRDVTIALNALENVNEDTDDVLLWLDENLPAEYKDPEDLALAYDRLSRADVFRGRISRWQHWRFLVYVRQLITAGVALSKKQSQRQFVAYKPTNRLFKIALARRKYEKKRGIAEKIAVKTHATTYRIIKDVLPYMHIMAKKNKTLAQQFEVEFELNNEEMEWMKS